MKMPELFFYLKKVPFKFCSTDKKEYLCIALQESTVARLAQLVEQLTLNQWVQGSNP